MDKTLINIFTSAPNGTNIDLPCADEKLILPIAAKVDVDRLCLCRIS